MSQRGSTSLPVSRASSQSPRTVPPSSSTRATLPIPPGVHDVPHNPDHSPPRMVSGDGSRLTPQSSRPYEPRRVVLNPLDSGVEGSNPPTGNPRSGSEPPPIPFSHGRVLSVPSAIATHHQHQQQPSSHAYYYSPSLGVNVPAASPQTDRRPLGVPGLDRASPTAVSPPPALNNPRAGPTSQPPRARSIHNPISRKTEEFYSPSTLPSLAGTKRPFDGDAEHRTMSSPPARSLQPSYLGPPESPTTLLPAASMLRNTPSRSFSQPVHPGSYQRSTSVQARAWPQQHHPSQLQAGWEQGSGYGASPLPAAARELQPFASGTPSMGPSIPCVVDTTSGSGAQTKKRKKNAEASSRHRQSKKAAKDQQDQEMEALRQAKEKLEQNVASLQQQLAVMERERETYRLWAEEYSRRLGLYERESDRPRELVSEASRGHPSPPVATRMTRVGMFPEEPAPRHQPGPSPIAHAMAQAGYPKSQTPDAAERESELRRPDRTPDVVGVPYGQRPQQQRQTPTHEPLQQSVGLPYAMASPRPEIAGYPMPLSRPPSASSTESLPPLRSIGAAAMGPGAPQAQRQHYGGRASYETRFLHTTREPPREPPREPEGGWSQP